MLKFYAIRFLFEDWLKWGFPVWLGLVWVSQLAMQLLFRLWQKEARDEVFWDLQQVIDKNVAKLTEDLGDEGSRAKYLEDWRDSPARQKAQAKRGIEQVLLVHADTVIHKNKLAQKTRRRILLALTLISCTMLYLLGIKANLAPDNSWVALSSVLALNLVLTIVYYAVRCGCYRHLEEDTHEYETDLIGAWEVAEQSLTQLGNTSLLLPKLQLKADKPANAQIRRELKADLASLRTKLIATLEKEHTLKQQKLRAGLEKFIHLEWDFLSTGAELAMRREFNILISLCNLAITTGENKPSELLVRSRDFVNLLDKFRKEFNPLLSEKDWTQLGDCWDNLEEDFLMLQFFTEDFKLIEGRFRQLFDNALEQLEESNNAKTAASQPNLPPKDASIYKSRARGK